MVNVLAIEYLKMASKVSRFFEYSIDNTLTIKGKEDFITVYY